MATSKRIAAGRLIGVAIALVGLGIAGYHVTLATKYQRWFDEWMIARPLEMQVDLSQTGTVTAPFRQTCSSAHGEAIYLQLEPAPDAAESVADLIHGLRAKMTVVDAVGVEVESLKLNSVEAKRTFEFDSSMIEMFKPFGQGDYVATLTVESPALKLAGKKQTLYARYQLCGLELFPVYICWAIALASGIVGMIAAVAAFPGVFRHGIYKPNS